MTPVSLNTTAPLIDFRSVSTIAAATQNQPVEAFPVDQNLTNAVDPALVLQLSERLAFDLTNIFRNINLFAIEAAEIGQTAENRAALQTNAEDELFNLRSLLDQLAQEELDLFVAVFENQLPEFSSSSSSTGSDTSILEDFSITDSSLDTLEGLFQVDLQTEQGIFAALNLADIFLDTLSVFNTGSDFLESFLEDLSLFSFNATLADSLELPAEEEVSTDTSDDDEDEIDVSTTTETPPLVDPDGNPPTIIELAG